MNDQLALFPEPQDTRREHAAIVRLVSWAIARGAHVRIRYVDAAGQETVREIVPRGLAYTTGSTRGWHLDAWCTLRQDDRTFVLGRIYEAELATSRRCAS